MKLTFTKWISRTTRKNATLSQKRRIVSNSVVNAKSGTTIDTI